MAPDGLEQRAVAFVQGDVGEPVGDGVVGSENLSDLLRGAAGDDAVSFLVESRLPRLRPILVVLAARAAGGREVDPELQYAAEMLHFALTLHDRVLGPNGNRRHALARRVLRGVGWIGSNRMLLRAMELARAGQSPAVFDELVDTLGAFHDGQEVADGLTREGVPDRTAWSEHADGHTGALLAFCCRVGAHVGGPGSGDVAALGRYGRHLGRIWHVAEDVLLLQGDDALDHLVGRALIGRPMLPVALAVERRPELAPLWRRIVDGHDAGAAAELLAAIHATRSLGGTREVVAREAWSARQEVTRFAETPYRRSLERLVSGLARAPYEDATALGLREDAG